MKSNVLFAHHPRACNESTFLLVQVQLQGQNDIHNFISPISSKRNVNQKTPDALSEHIRYSTSFHHQVDHRLYPHGIHIPDFVIFPFFPPCATRQFNSGEITCSYPQWMKPSSMTNWLVVWTIFYFSIQLWIICFYGVSLDVHTHHHYDTSIMAQEKQVCNCWCFRAVIPVKQVISRKLTLFS